MHRVRAVAALALTAFFAVAGSFHHHHDSAATHEHAGFCSIVPADPALESCALCKATHSPFQLTALFRVPAVEDAASHRMALEAFTPGAGRSLLSHPRAPPRV